MNNKKNVIIRRIFNIIFTVSIFIAGVCLITGCLSIYDWGEGAYTRELVIDTFSKISLPVYICLALTVVSFIWNFIEPSKDADRRFIPYEHILEKLYIKKDLELCEHDLKSAILKEQKKRKAFTLIRTIIMCISFSVFFAYAFNPNNYASDINASVIKAMWVLIPCLAIPLVCSIIVCVQNEKSLKNEIEFYKKAPASENIKEEKISKNEKSVILIRFAILFIGIGSLVYGYFAGGTADVLTKAINICTECIGLG